MSEQEPKKYDKQILFFLFIVTLLLCMMVSKAIAGEVRTLRLSDENVARIGVSLRGTILSFPIKPTKVILGNQGAFGLEYVENDLAITPLSGSGRSHLFVYLYGRRFSFDLTTEPASGTAIVIVRDALDVEPKKVLPKKTVPALSEKPPHALNEKSRR